MLLYILRKKNLHPATPRYKQQEIITTNRKKCLKKSSDGEEITVNTSKEFIFTALEENVKLQIHTTMNKRFGCQIETLYLPS